MLILSQLTLTVTTLLFVVLSLCLVFNSFSSLYEYNVLSTAATTTTSTTTTVLRLWIFSGTIQVSWYRKGKTKTSLDFLEQETVSGSGIRSAGPYAHLHLAPDR